MMGITFSYLSTKCKCSNRIKKKKFDNEKELNQKISLYEQKYNNLIIETNEEEFNYLLEYMMNNLDEYENYLEFEHKN